MILKNPKIIVWLLFVIISIILIAPRLDTEGQKVTFIGKNITGDLVVGDVILEINNQKVTPELLSSNYDGIVKFTTKGGNKFLRVNGSLNIITEDVQSTNIKFGLDIKGGVRAIVDANTTDQIVLDQAIATLQERINLFGLRETSFRSIKSEDNGFIEISIAGGSLEELRDLLESQGKFEAKIPLLLRTAQNKTMLKMDKDYELVVLDGSINVNNQIIGVGDAFNISGVYFVLNGISSNTINLTSTVFTGDDIITVFLDPQRSRVELTQTGYDWFFSVELSANGAQKFAYVTNNLGIVPGGYLDAPIILYLDNEIIDSLNIVSSLKGRTETQISITGSAATLDEAVSERNKLQSILRSGALPTSISIVQLDTVSPTLGSDFLFGAALAGVVAIIGVICVVAIRYKKIKVVLPMVVISLSEVLIILGITSAIGSTIDIAAIAGLIAAIGTGIDSQIIILDQAVTKQATEETMRQKLKRAFFIVFGSGATVIGAMLPLLILGFGLLRGFAIVTIIGVLIGILITRPAYGVIVEKFVK